jgi:hypothetical protein
MQKSDGVFTFRKWNPKKQDCLYGENNDPEDEAVCLFCACCPCVGLIDKCF